MKTIQKLIHEFRTQQDRYLISKGEEDLTTLYLILHEYLNQVLLTKIKKGDITFQIDIPGIAHKISSDTVCKYRTKEGFNISYVQSYFNQAIYNTIHYQKAIDRDTVKEKTIEDYSEYLSSEESFEETILTQIDEEKIIKDLEIIIDDEMKNIEDDELYDKVITSIIDCIGRKKSFESYLYRLTKREKKLFSEVMTEIKYYLQE